MSKPQMRGFLVSRFKRDMVISFSAGIVLSIAYKIGWVDPHKQKYADFYKTYDAEADFERMRKAGVFNSVSAD